MDNLEVKDSRLWLSIQSAKGELQSISCMPTLRTFEEFAHADCVTGDIDPTYWAIYRSRKMFGEDWARRFCVAMLTYYHTGTAARAADFEGEEFWDHLESIYDSAPRASERRHFRGANGRQGLASMRAFSPEPENFFTAFSPSYFVNKGICERHLKQFGPYFQLKLCDYMDRCLDLPIQNYVGLERNLPTLPAKAVAELHPNRPIPQGFEMAVARIQETGLLAPPLYDRLIGPAEVETILCDWKRARTGSSWVGADVLDKRTALRGYGEKAEALADLIPPVPPRKLFKLELE